MTFSLRGCAAIVTGASQGWRLAIGQAYVAAGANVLLCACSIGTLSYAYNKVQELATSDQIVIAETLDISKPLVLCREGGWIKVRGKQRTDSTHVLVAIRALRRMERVREMMGHAFTLLAEVAPSWLFEHLDPVCAESQRHRYVDEVGLVTLDTSWSALEAGHLDHSHFLVDWQAKWAVALQGKPAEIGAYP